jgi:hypothetical protein
VGCVREDGLDGANDWLLPVIELDPDQLNMLNSTFKLLKNK